jgi:hypothetical protein
MRTIALTILGPLLLSAASLHAQGKPTAPLVLRLPASTRGLALGNLAVASGNDDVIFYNPAQLAVARAASLSVQRFSEGAIAGALSAAMAFNNGGVGIGAQWVSFDALAPSPFTPANLTQRRGVPAASAAATLGVAQVFHGVRIGVAGKVAQEIADVERSLTVLGDVGAGKDFKGFLNVGLALRNLGQSNKAASGATVPPPTRLTLGAQASRPIAALSSALSPFIDIAGAAELTVLRDGWIKPAAGLELVYTWIEGYSFILRGGIRRPELGERPTTMGAGLVADRIRVEYALEPREGGSISHRFGLRIR